MFEDSNGIKVASITALGVVIAALTTGVASIISSSQNLGNKKSGITINQAVDKKSTAIVNTGVIVGISFEQHKARIEELEEKERKTIARLEEIHILKQIYLKDKLANSEEKVETLKKEQKQLKKQLSITQQELADERRAFKAYVKKDQQKQISRNLTTAHSNQSEFNQKEDFTINKDKIENTYERNSPYQQPATKNKNNLVEKVPDYNQYLPSDTVVADDNQYHPADTVVEDNNQYLSTTTVEDQCGSALVLEETPPTPDLPAPENLIQDISGSLKSALQRNQVRIMSNRAYLYQLANEVIAPHFDFNRLSGLALGKHWRRATLTQKKEFMLQFQRLLVRTYATAFCAFGDWSLRFVPRRDAADAVKVMVRSEIQRSGAPPVSVNYRMHQQDDTWLAYDIIIEGISLVTNYRTTFAKEVRRNGMDGLIKRVTKLNDQRIAASQ